MGPQEFQWKSPIGGKEEPILRCHDSYCPNALNAELQAALHETICEIGLRLVVSTLTIILEGFTLFTATKIGHVSRNECELSGENFRRARHATCGHDHFVGGVILGFLR